MEISDHLTDAAAVLGDGEAAVRESLVQQATNGEVTLWAVFVSSFDTQGNADWLEQTARLSALEPSDVLLAVAVGSATYDYGWWMDDSSPLSEAQLQELIDTVVVPQLDAGNWGAAVIALAGQLESAAGSAEDSAEAPAWSARTTMTVVAALAAALLVGHVLSRRRPSGGPSEHPSAGA
jgi:hypothetical protein